jgi:hypothetical protein
MIRMSVSRRYQLRVRQNMPRDGSYLGAFLPQPGFAEARTGRGFCIGCETMSTGILVRTVDKLAAGDFMVSRSNDPPILRGKLKNEMIAFCLGLQQ